MSLWKWNQPEWLKKRLARSWTYGTFFSVGTAFIAWILPHPDGVADGLPLPYRIFFVFGILGSVCAQTTVATFLIEAKAYDGVDLPARHLVEQPSNVLLAVFAILSLININDFWAHMFWTQMYVLLVLGLDIWVAIHSHRAGASGNAVLLSRICNSLIWKIDGFSLFGLLGVSCLTLGLWNVSVPLDDLSDKTESGHILAEGFLSGAIGFHFLVTTWLIVRYLLEWDGHIPVVPNKSVALPNQGAIPQAGAR